MYYAELTDGLYLIGTANSVFPSPETSQPPNRNKKNFNC